MWRTLTTLATVAGLVTVAACGTPPGDEPARSETRHRPPEPSREAPRPPPPESVAANELGEVPILMYHRITDEPTSVYDRTPAAFRAELRRLAEEDYVPVAASEYATGDIDIPAGTHPVVLTFDDATTSQFRLNDAGEPAAGTAVRILLEVAERHPAFRPVASFYVTTPPFGGAGTGRALTWLHEHGFELGNHTLTHPNLGQLPAGEVRHEIATMQRRITEAVPEATVTTMALPLGVHPDDRRLALSGNAEGARYRHDAVLLVGSSPAPSPYSTEFDPLGVPRIRSQGPSGKGAKFGSTTWLNELAANPRMRYTSDGNPEVISLPEGADARIAEDYADEVRRY